MRGCGWIRRKNWKGSVKKLNRKLRNSVKWKKMREGGNLSLKNLKLNQRRNRKKLTHWQKKEIEAKQKEAELNAQSEKEKAERNAQREKEKEEFELKKLSWNLILEQPRVKVILQ